jgi:hypothetical protein
MAITYHAGRRIQGIAGVDVADTHTSTATPSGTYPITLGGGSGSGATRCGLEVHTGHFLIDKGLKTIKFNMDRYGSVSGTGHAQVYDSSGNTKGSTSSTYSLSGLPAYPVSTNGVTFTWTTPVVIADGDRIMVEGGSFNTSNQVDFYGVNTTPDSNINPIGYNSGTWTAQSGADTYFVATTETNNGDTKPTDVQVGSRFEETDTRKMYHYGDYPTVSDDLTTDKGWVSNTGSWTYNATGDYIDFATITRSTTAQRIYIDVQDSDYLGSGNNLSDSSWVARFKIRTGTQSSSTGNVLLYFGFSNNLEDSGTTQQSATMMMNFNGGANENNMQLAVSRANFETTGSPARVNSDVYSNTNLPYSTDVYMEMIRDGDVFTLKAYSDEYVTQASSTSVASATVTGISTLRYIKAFNDSEQAQSYTSGGARLYDMKIYNGVTSAGNEWKELGT